MDAVKQHHRDYRRDTITQSKHHGERVTHACRHAQARNVRKRPARASCDSVRDWICLCGEERAREKFDALWELNPQHRQTNGIAESRD